MDAFNSLFPLLAFVTGVAIGAGVTALLIRSIYKQRLEFISTRAQEREQEHEQALAQTTKSMEHTFGFLAKKVLDESSEAYQKAFLNLADQNFKKLQSEASGDLEKRKVEIAGLVNPLKQSLEKLEAAQKQIEEKREGAYMALREQVTHLTDQTRKIGDTSLALSTALRGSIKARGDWGQIGLQNVVELAGMKEHCDFDVEVTLKSGKGGARVDVLVRLPGGAGIPIDAKLPFAEYWDGINSDDPDERTDYMKAHAKTVRRHVDDLTRRNYGSLIEQSPDFTVMYIQADPILAAAFQADPTLQSYALSKHILITTPVTLLALLQTVGLYWQQQSVSDNAKAILDEAKKLYERVTTFSDHLAGVGKGLESALKKYNSAVGSYERSVLPVGRRLEQLKVTDLSSKSLPELTTVETPLRSSSCVTPLSK